MHHRQVKSLLIATDKPGRHAGVISLTASLLNKVKENINKVKLLRLQD
jgi:hypothetical protein